MLGQYGELSGQVVNFDKSNVVFSANTHGDVREELAGMMGVRPTRSLGRYLGLEVDFRQSKKALFGFVRDKVDSRIRGWAEQFLSQAGKEVLLKAVCLALPVYTMQCF